MMLRLTVLALALAACGPAMAAGECYPGLGLPCESVPGSRIGVGEPPAPSGGESSKPDSGTTDQARPETPAKPARPRPQEQAKPLPKPPAKPEAPACETVRYNHNGSDMRATRCGTRLTIAYSRPKSSIRGQGVKSGTVLVEARIKGSSISGTAYTFKAGCGRAPFPVSGGYRGGGIVLSGTYERRDAACAVIEQRADTLVFD